MWLSSTLLPYFVTIHICKSLPLRLIKILNTIRYQVYGVVVCHVIVIIHILDPVKDLFII